MNRNNNDLINHRLPLLNIELNKTLYRKEPSPYCNRVKESFRKNSLYYFSTKPKRDILVCCGATTRMSLKTQSQPRKKSESFVQPHKARRKLTLLTDELDISPWEYY